MFPKVSRTKDGAYDQYVPLSNPFRTSSLLSDMLDVPVDTSDGKGSAYGMTLTCGQMQQKATAG
jgi:hypothetical protein